MIRKLPIVNTLETVGRPGKGNYPLLCAFHGQSTKADLNSVQQVVFQGVLRQLKV